MTVVTTRPDATVANGSSTVTGAASRHAALNDDSDSSYVTLPAGGSPVQIGFGEPSIPGGAIYGGATIRARLAKVSDNAALFTRPSPHTNFTTTEWGMFVTWATPATITLSVSEVANQGYTWPPTSPVAVIELAARSAGADVRAYELFYDTTYVAKPTLNVTAPTGTVTDTNTPTVTWTETLDSDGGAQTKYEVKVFSAAQYGAGGFDPSTSTATYNSGILSGSSLSHAVASALANATYRAYVRVGQTVNGATHWSDWDYEGFVINVTPPNAPTITLSAEGVKGRIKVELDDAATGASTDLFEAQVSRDGGVTWESMRLLASSDRITPSGGLATVYDYEAPNGVDTYYRARALHSYSGEYAVSSWVTAHTSWSSSTWWLKHPTKPAMNLAVVPYSAPGISRASRQGVFNVLGRKFPVVVDGVRGGRSGTLVLEVDTDEEHVALVKLLDETTTLLLQARSGHHFEDAWVRFQSQDGTRIVDKLEAEPTFESLPWVEVDRPAGVIEDWAP